MSGCGIWQQMRYFMLFIFVWMERLGMSHVILIMGHYLENVATL